MQCSCDLVSWKTLLLLWVLINDDTSHSVQINISPGTAGTVDRYHSRVYGESSIIKAHIVIAIEVGAAKIYRNAGRQLPVSETALVVCCMENPLLDREPR